jgi:hypothetical protein
MRILMCDWMEGEKGFSCKFSLIGKCVLWGMLFEDDFLAILKIRSLSPPQIFKSFPLTPKTLNPSLPSGGRIFVSSKFLRPAFCTTLINIVWFKPFIFLQVHYG